MQAQPIAVVQQSSEAKQQNQVVDQIAQLTEGNVAKSIQSFVESKKVLHEKVDENEPDFEYLNKMTNEDESNAFG